MAYIPKQNKKSFQRIKPKRFGKDPFYNKTSWRRTSTNLRKQNPICLVCDERPSQVCDHVIGREIGGANYDVENLLAMCHQCHNIKRAMEARTSSALIDTKTSATEDKLTPVNKQDIIPLLIRGVKSMVPNDVCSEHTPIIGEWKRQHMIESNEKAGIKKQFCDKCKCWLYPEEF